MYRAIAVLSVVSILSLIVPNAESRPPYRKEFAKKYKATFQNTKITCSVCHSDNTKKKRNLYGVAIGKHINKNEKDTQRIQDVLEIVHHEESHIPGVTWGELITQKKLPPIPDPLPDPAANEDANFVEHKVTQDVVVQFRDQHFCWSHRLSIKQCDWTH